MRSTNPLLLALLVSLASFFCQPLQAQWRVGLSGGADHNWYSINTNYQSDYRYDGAWGWSAAVFGQYDFLPWLGLRAEVEATERNYRFRRTGIYAATNYVTRNTYLQLPVMAQFRFGGSKVYGFANIGVYAGCWLSSRYQGTMYDPLVGSKRSIDQTYSFQPEKDQRGDFGLAGGIGIGYRFHDHWAIHAEGRCYYSFISAVKPYMGVKDNRYNTTIGMNIGFAYIF